VTVAVAPIGIFGPLEGVWGIPLALSLAVLLAYPIRTEILWDAGLFLGFVAFAVVSAGRSSAGPDAVEMGFALVTTAAVYISSRVVIDDDPTQLLLVRTFALVWVVVLSIFLFASRVVDVPDGIAFDYPVRHAAMTTIPLLALALGTRRRVLVSALIGGLAVGGALATGSRTASALLVFVLVGLLADRLSNRARILAGLGLIVAIGLAISLPSVQQRWLGQIIEDPFRNPAALSVNSSGRTGVWAETLDSCQGSPVLGLGLGTANQIANSVHEGFPDPHNEFIRFYCDTGIVGSVLLWGFVALSFRRIAGLLRRRARHPAGMVGLVSLISLVAFSLVWNPITAAEFMIPLVVVLAWSDDLARRV
jgi:O-antigen ligase